MSLSYREEETLNAISHGFGAVLGLVGFVLLLKNNTRHTEYANFAIITYSLSLILLFVASAWYHSIAEPSLKKKLRVLDHISIYYLIAGTYTPVSLITLESGNGWTIFYVVWGMALVGTLLKLFFTGRFEVFSLLLYLFMGWMIVFDFRNLTTQLSKEGLWLMGLGGAFYTLGILFYAIRRIPYNHLIWHIFVLGGAISHWFMIYLHVI
ncbi:PAQR family membrane homeostasis protein TrhA [Poritiphilus flavus]|uniref:Hemolysin III family protein n=1 Tax=Poritiphilus flavus TaxID=2697053 RepID=A0A6L9EF84_9FLAO|nr:hemolysin III family protein [Poritiphilus flavus]NAS13341.1 hemolysin III family protein [Poritiphilus flavus]